jgi:hypothetical protein
MSNSIDQSKCINDEVVREPHGRSLGHGEQAERQRRVFQYPARRYAKSAKSMSRNRESYDITPAQAFGSKPNGLYDVRSNQLGQANE